MSYGGWRLKPRLRAFCAGRKAHLRGLPDVRHQGIRWAAFRATRDGGFGGEAQRSRAGAV